jgi:hypothetical protein
MGSRTDGAGVRFRCHAWLGMLIPLVVSSGAASAAHPTVRFELRGACYCQEADRLTCVGDLTKPECDKKCAEIPCDDWFWLERRSCWNWGYGG